MKNDLDRIAKFTNDSTWKKGQSGNPSGRPFIKLRQRLSVITAERLSEPAPRDLCKLVGLRARRSTTVGKVIVEALVREGAQGNVAACRALFEFTEAAKSLININLLGDVSERRLEELRARYREMVEAEARQLATGDGGDVQVLPPTQVKK